MLVLNIGTNVGFSIDGGIRVEVVKTTKPGYGKRPGCSLRIVAPSTVRILRGEIASDRNTVVKPKRRDVRNMGLVIQRSAARMDDTSANRAKATVLIGEHISLFVLKVQWNAVRLGIEAPREVGIVRDGIK